MLWHCVKTNCGKDLIRENTCLILSVLCKCHQEEEETLAYLERSHQVSAKKKKTAIERMNLYQRKFLFLFLSSLKLLQRARWYVHNLACYQLDVWGM